MVLYEKYHSILNEIPEIYSITPGYNYYFDGACDQLDCFNLFLNFCPGVYDGNGRLGCLSCIPKKEKT